ncbi:hypothetical protein FKM82_004342 [Ascaphus truei]
MYHWASLSSVVTNVTVIYSNASLFNLDNDYLYIVCSIVSGEMHVFQTPGPVPLRDVTSIDLFVDMKMQWNLGEERSG